MSKKVVSVVLVLAVFLSTWAPNVFASELAKEQESNSTKAYDIVDGIVMDDYALQKRDRLKLENPNISETSSTELSKEFSVENEMLLWQKEDEKKIDRFIIKYKSNDFSRRIKNIETVSNKIVITEISKRQEREQKLRDKFADSDKKTDIEARIYGFKNRISGLPKSDNKKTVISRREINDASYDIVQLEESVDPSTYINALDSFVNTGDIEYIQPDYKLELSGVVELAVEQPIDNTDVSKEEPTNTEATVEKSIEEDTTKDNSPKEEATNENTVQKDVTNEKQIEVPKEPIVDKNDNLIYNIDVNLEEAHKVTKGEGSIVALIDTGVDITHPGLLSNMINGYDFINDTGNVYNPELGMEQAHGTHIAGIIAKVAPEAKIMPMKVFENGNAYTSDIIEAIQFAEANGASIVNCSWGCTDNNQALRETMEQSSMTFICAVGNNRLNLSETPIYPASFGLNNTISVTAFNNDFGLSYFSNYNSQSVDISAWGRDVYSTFPNGEYGIMSGTSMSAGYVTGAAALVATQGVTDIKQQLKSTSDKLSCLQTKVNNGNRINFNNAVNNIVYNTIVNITPEDDFDAQGYQRTPEENWELFCSLDNIQVAAGGSHSVALKSDGTVWAWGYNVMGQLGDGTIIDGTNLSRPTPMQVPGLTGIVEISAGYFHTIALKNDGTVYAWGWNSFGQLGDGYTTNSTIPKQIPGLNSVAKISTGFGHTMALKNDGTVWAWGANWNGQLGDGTIDNKTTPIHILSLTDIAQVSAGEYYSMAVKYDGTVWTWGNNAYGQLGDVDTSDRKVPGMVPGLNGIIQVSGYNHSMALKYDGTVYTWGYNYYGQLGDGEGNSNRPTPIQVPGLPFITQVAAGNGHSMALADDLTVWTWGNNGSGQLGDGGTTSRSTPLQVPGFIGITQIAGSQHSMAIKNGGAVLTWGSNGSGQLGDGGYVNRPTPYCIQGEINDIQGNTYDKAHRIYPSCQITGAIDVQGDLDWFSFIAPTTGEYTMETDSGIDTYGYLYNEAGATTDSYLTYNDDNGYNTNFRIIYSLIQGQKYYVKIRHYSSGTGSYIFRIGKKISVSKIFNTSFGEDIYLSAVGKNISSESTLCELAYNPQQLQIVNFFAQTYEIPATNIYDNITIKEYGYGKVIFIVNNNIPLGKSWTGVLNMFKFESLVDGQTTVSITAN